MTLKFSPGIAGAMGVEESFTESRNAEDWQRWDLSTNL